MENIIEQLTAERDRLNTAISILTVNGSSPFTVNKKRRGRKKLTAAAKKRISQAMKKRWAERKKGVKK